MGISSQRSIRLGAGAGFSGDRIDPAVELAEHGQLDYLIFECLGERTVAHGQQRRREEATAGFDPLLVRRITAVIEAALKNGTTIITNGGSANPSAAAAAVYKALQQLQLSRPVRIAAVTGDDVLGAVTQLDPIIWETGEPVSQAGQRLLSANAYLGADALLPALSQRADVIIAGRVADPSLYLAPLMHEFGWKEGDHRLLGRGTCVGHLLECAGQLTGGYFADPVTKPVPGLARLGFPFADVASDGTSVVGKLERSGGLIDRRTCREQLLYEVHDPHAYLTPDVTADFSDVSFIELSPNFVEVRGADGYRRPPELKVSLGFEGGWMGEGQISYTGLRAQPRAQLAAEIVVERLQQVHRIPAEALTVELIGTGSGFRGASNTISADDAPEVRLRISGRFDEPERAQLVSWEVESLYTNGPAGGGGARGSHAPVIAIRAATLPRHVVNVQTEILEVDS